MQKLLLVLSTALILSACSNSVPKKLTTVYINSGAIQCEGNGKTGLETAQLLTDQNITVENTECGHLANIAVIAMCGSVATNINLHTIQTVDLEKAQALGFENVTTLEQEDHLGYSSGECK